MFQPFLLFHGNVADIVHTVPTTCPKTVRLLGKADLKQILRTKPVVDQLFPNGRLIADWAPYRLLESNVDHFFNDHCHIIGSGLCTGSSEGPGLMTLGIIYPTPAGLRCSLDIYGEISEKALSLHLEEHLKQCMTFDNEEFIFLICYEDVTHNSDVITRTMERHTMFETDILKFNMLYCVEESLL